MTFSPGDKVYPHGNRPWKEPVLLVKAVVDLDGVEYLILDTPEGYMLNPAEYYTKVESND